MPETGPKEIDSSEIVQEQKKDNTSKERTIEEALQESLPNDESKQQLFLEIFNQSTFTNLPQQNTNNELSQTNIIEYIKSGRLFGNSRSINRMNSLEEKTKFIIEDMDKYFKSTTGSVKEIMVTNNNLTEQVDQTTEQVDQTTEQVKIKNTLLESRKATKESYDQLDKAKYPEPTDEEIAEEKKNITEETQKKLDANELSADDYAKFLVFEQKYEKDLRKDGNSEFLENLSTLKQDLGDETTMTETINNKENVDKIIEERDDLNNKANNINLSIPDLPETENIDKEFSTYVKFITNEDIKNNIQKNEDIIKAYAQSDEGGREEQNEEGKKAYQEYTAAIQDIKENFQERMQKITKQRVLGTCITGLAKYFTPSTINKQNFGEDFDIDTHKGFSIEKGERKYDEANDDVLYIKGNIKGNAIGFYYNLDNPNAQLKSDDFLNLDKNNDFSFGAGSGGKKELGIKLPTLQLLTDQAQKVIEQNFTNGLQKASNLEDFETTLKDQISSQLLKNYRQEALVKTRVERDIEKNITVQTLQNSFFPKPVMTKLNNGETKNINNTTEKTARDIINIWDTTTENMRSDELRKFRGLIERLDREMRQKRNPNLEEDRTNILNNMRMDQRAGEYTEQRGTSIKEYFEALKNNSGKININDLEIFVKTLEKNESIGENINKFSPEFQTKQDQKNADKLIENIE